MSTYINFQLTPQDPKKKTAIWEVVTKDGQSILGQVRWYAPWRKYCFYPIHGYASHIYVIFEQVCLRDIADFIESETKKHKQKGS